MTNSKLREIPNKNYIIAGVYVLVSIIVMLYVTKQYLVWQEDTMNKAIISDYLVEVSYEEFANYLIENNSAIVYTGIANDKTCRTYENTFKNIVESYGLQDQIIYLNITTFSSNTNYIALFNTVYGTNQKLLHQVPALLIFENGKINAISDDNLDKQKTIKFLKKYEIIE